MNYGKKVCASLRQVRKQIAEANDISYEVTECKHQGDCRGTCPKCEAELRFIENQLSLRRAAGMAVTVVGISLGVATTFSACTAPQKTKVADASEPECKVANEVDRVVMLEGDVCINVTETSPSDSMPAKEKDIEDIELPVLGDVDNIEVTFVEEHVLADGESDGPDAIYDVVDEGPEFPGGEYALMLYISKNLRIPPEIDTPGRVVLSFIVEKDGSISNIEVLHSASELYAEVAILLVESMPKWKPGKVNGKAVRTKWMIPISIRPQ